MTTSNASSFPRRRRILLVEDDETTREVLGEFLDDEGYEVTLAVNGVQALTAMLGRLPDLLVTDLHMPGLDGSALIGRIRLFAPELPIIVISGNSDPDDRDGVARLGAQALLPKPVVLDALRKTIRSLLGRPTDGEARIP